MDLDRFTFASLCLGVSGMSSKGHLQTFFAPVAEIQHCPVFCRIAREINGSISPLPEPKPYHSKSTNFLHPNPTPSAATSAVATSAVLGPRSNRGAETAPRGGVSSSPEARAIQPPRQVKQISGKGAPCHMRRRWEGTRENMMKVRVRVRFSRWLVG